VTELLLALSYLAAFTAGVLIGRAFGRHAGFDEARRLWDDDPTQQGGA
jgi:hypothetical protein